MPSTSRRRTCFSASAAVHTDGHHHTAIKAVCTAICSDVRLLEKRQFTRAWLEGLWHINVDDGTRPAQLRECRERASVAGRANFAAETYSRLETRGGGRNDVFKCPATWSKKRVEGAEHLFDNCRWEGGDRSLALAHVRTRTADQEHGLAPIDNEYLATISERLSWALSVALCSIPGR